MSVIEDIKESILRANSQLVENNIPSAYLGWCLVLASLFVGISEFVGVAQKFTYSVSFNRNILLSLISMFFASHIVLWKSALNGRTKAFNRDIAVDNLWGILRQTNRKIRYVSWAKTVYVKPNNDLVQIDEISLTPITAPLHFLRVATYAESQEQSTILKAKDNHDQPLHVIEGPYIKGVRYFAVVLDPPIIPDETFAFTLEHVQKNLGVFLWMGKQVKIVTTLILVQDL